MTSVSSYINCFNYYDVKYVISISNLFMKAKMRKRFPKVKVQISQAVLFVI